MFSLEPFKFSTSAISDRFRDLENWADDFFGDRVFPRKLSFAFQTDIKDTGTAYQLDADLPGFKKEDIKIDLEGDYLSINAERHSEFEEKDKQGNFVRCERSYGSYHRKFDVADVNTDQITSTYNDGVLTLIMPKKEIKEAPPSRRIEIT